MMDNKYIRFYKSETEKKNVIKYSLIAFVVSIILTSILNQMYLIKQVSFNPIKILKYGLWDISLSYRCCGVLFFIIILIILLVLHYKRTENPNDLVSKESQILGSHHIATEEELKNYLDVQKAEDYYSEIIGWVGNIDKDAKKNEKTARNNAVAFLPDTIRGPHKFLIGPPGSFKSSNQLILEGMMAIDRGESVIITDPKGEIRKVLYLYAKSKGCVVKELNLIDPYLSDGVNFLDYVTDDDSARMITSSILNGLREKNGGKEDFWEIGEKEWIHCVIMYLCETLPKGDKRRSIRGILDFTLNNSIKEINEIMECLPIGSVTKDIWRAFAGEDNKRVQVNDAFRQGVASKLGAFNDAMITQMTSVSNDIDLTLPVKKQCVYFVMISDTKRSNNFLANLFFTILFDTNIVYADIFNRTSVPVKFILEEFCNIGEIPDIRTKLATIRSRKMYCTLCIQGFQQLEDTYGVEMGAFLDNVDTLMIFRMNDPKKAKDISDIAGEGTVMIEQQSREEHPLNPLEIHTKYNNKKTPTQIKVMSVADIIKLNPRQYILSFPDCEMAIINKFYYKWHPASKQLVEQSYLHHMPSWWEDMLNDKNINEATKNILRSKLQNLKELRRIELEQAQLPEYKQKHLKVEKEDVREIGVKDIIKRLKNKSETVNEEEVVVNEENDDLDKLLVDKNNNKRYEKSSTL